MTNENTSFNNPIDASEQNCQHTQQGAPHTQSDASNQQYQGVGNIPPQPPYEPQTQNQQYAPVYAARKNEKQLFGLYDPTLQARVSTVKKVLYTIAGFLFGIIAALICFLISRDTVYEGQFKAEMFWVMVGILLSYAIMIATWLLGIPISLFSLLI